MTLEAAPILKNRGSVIVFLFHGNTVVMQHRSEDAEKSPGLLTGFGGRIDDTDTNPLWAMQREIDEEIADADLIAPIVEVDRLPARQRQDIGANGPLYIFMGRLARPDITVIEGQGSVSVPVDMFEQWSEPAIVPDARAAFTILRKEIGI